MIWNIWILIDHRIFKAPDTLLSFHSLLKPQIPFLSFHSPQTSRNANFIHLFKMNLIKQILNNNKRPLTSKPHILNKINQKPVMTLKLSVDLLFKNPDLHQNLQKKNFHNLKIKINQIFYKISPLSLQDMQPFLKKFAYEFRENPARFPRNFIIILRQNLIES